MRRRAHRRLAASQRGAHGRYLPRLRRRRRRPRGRKRVCGNDEQHRRGPSGPARHAQGGRVAVRGRRPPLPTRRTLPCSPLAPRLRPGSPLPLVQPRSGAGPIYPGRGPPSLRERPLLLPHLPPVQGGARIPAQIHRVLRILLLPGARRVAERRGCVQGCLFLAARVTASSSSAPSLQSPPTRTPPTRTPLHTPSWHTQSRARSPVWLRGPDAPGGSGCVRLVASGQRGPGQRWGVGCGVWGMGASPSPSATHGP